MDATPGIKPWTSNHKYNILFNQFQAKVPFLYPSKTSENFCFTEAFNGYRNIMVIEYLSEMAGCI